MLAWGSGVVMAQLLTGMPDDDLQILPDMRDINEMYV